MPNMSSWSHLYRPQPGLLSQLLWPKGASAMTRLLRWNYAKASTVAVPLLEEAHGDFEVEGFTQCASQAIAAVLELYAAADWADGFIGLLQSMQQAHEEQQSASSVHVDISQLDIVCVHSITQQQLAAIDEQRAGQQLMPAEFEAASGAESADAVGAAATAAAGSYWDVCHVYAEASWRADVRLEDDAAVKEVQQPRSGHWVLCRGPVLPHKAIPAEADKPWFMLAWM
ncbi:hypothetical protein COO60DRAFT_1601281 [Scenedesmus sp. NREL 46B-D3]|nr:hypothetical protein COO60DRAFT_1601281 [Scenedesmus sp. NREL 46B-D3]